MGVVVEGPGKKVKLTPNFNRSGIIDGARKILSFHEIASLSLNFARCGGSAAASIAG